MRDACRLCPCRADPGNAHGGGGCGANGDAHPISYNHAAANVDTHPDGIPDADQHTHPYSVRHTDADRHLHPVDHADVHDYTHGDQHTDAEQYTHADRYTNICGGED